MAHSNACMPPSDPPATAARRWMPSSSRNARSRAHHIGDGDDRKIRPVRLAGRRIDQMTGPSCPRHPPSRFVDTTKKRSVSKALPGPIIPSHQPSPFAAVWSRSSAAEAVPRALLRRRFRDAGGVRVAAQRVAHEDDVVARRGKACRRFRTRCGWDAARGRSRAGAAWANRGTGFRPSRPSLRPPLAGGARDVAMRGIISPVSASVRRVYDSWASADAGFNGYRKRRRIHHGDSGGQQRSQRPGASGRTRGVERRARGHEVHVAGVVQVAERHVQQDERAGILRSRRRSSSTRPKRPSTPTIPEIFASEDRGITPIEYVLVGLASCLTAGVAAVAQNRGVQLRSVESKLEGKMDIRGILGMDSRCAERLRRHQGDVQDRCGRTEEGHRGDRRAVAEALGGVRRDHEPGERHRRSRLTTRVTTVVIGAGHAGLAASRFLTDRSIDHVVLERGEVANSWRRERWDSLRLLTPNCQSRLPGYRYDGPDPDGYMTMSEVIEFISRFASRVAGAGAHEHERHLAEAHGRWVSRCDEQRRLRVPLCGDRERRLQSAERAAASRRRACADRTLHPLQLPQPRPAARRRRARRRSVGDRRAAGRAKFIGLAGR